jgi:cytoskeleton protein RodZ
MTSIGETLRRERKRRNLELPKIAGELKISARFLEAMEVDDFAKLPGGVFTKSFVRQYATFLGLNGDELVTELERSAEPPPDVPQLPDKAKPDVPGIDLEMGESNWQSVRERRAPLPSWLKAGVLLIVLMVICSGVYYWWWQRPRHQVLAHETPPPTKAIPTAPAAPPPSRPASATVTPPSETPIANPTPADLAPAPPATAAAIPVVATNPNATVHVGIVADEAVWVRADVNGKLQFAGVLQPHETRNIDVDGEVTLRLGNAGGATLTWNGKPVGEVGPKGQIRTVQFTSGGFQIVSPPKVLEPLDRL